MSIGIGYYRLTNGAIGVVIYPQLRAANDANNVIWDGRDNSGFAIYAEQTETIPLSETGVPQGEDFLLSEDTVWGKDEWLAQPVFHWDPTSNLVATVTLSGTADIGSMTYDGLSPYTGEMVPKDGPASTAAAASIQEVLQQIKPDEDVSILQLGTGTVTWAPNSSRLTVLRAVGLIATNLISKGLIAVPRLSMSNNRCAFKLSMRRLDLPPGSIGPEIPVQQYWDAAVAAAANRFPNLQLKNSGIAS